MNIRNILQNQKLNSLTKEELDTINENHKFEYHKNWDTLIETNFIMYNEATINLIKKIYKNICANYFTHDKQNFTTFFVTCFELTDKNVKLGLCRNVDTTKKRIQKLEEEGVIGRIMRHGQKGGQFIYLKVDISEPFVRPEKINTEEVEVNNTEELHKMNEEEIKEGKEENCLFVKELQERDVIISQLQENIKLLQEEIMKLKKQDNKSLIEIKNNELIDNVNIEGVNLLNHDKNEFKNMFEEFCNARRDGKGVKIAKKTPRAVKMLVNKMRKLSNSGYDVYNLLEEALSKGWRDVYEINDCIIDYEKYQKNDFFKKKVVEETTKEIAKYSGKKIAKDMILKKEAMEMSEEMNVIEKCRKYCDGNEINELVLIKNILTCYDYFKAIVNHFKQEFPDKNKDFFEKKAHAIYLKAQKRNKFYPTYIFYKKMYDIVRRLKADYDQKEYEGRIYKSLSDNFLDKLIYCTKDDIIYYFVTNDIFDLKKYNKEKYNKMVEQVKEEYERTEEKEKKSNDFYMSIFKIKKMFGDLFEK